MEPIFEAVLTSQEEVARLLRQDRAIVRTRASRDSLVETIPHWLYAGDTSLHLAAAGLRPGVAGILLESGADPNAQNRRGATPLHYACDPRPKLAGTWNPTTQASLIKLLVDHGAEINRGDRGGATALHRAVRARSVAAVRQLLALGARTDCVLKKRGSSPLHLAVQPTGASGTAGMLSEQVEIVDLLLQHGADPAAADTAGRTPGDWVRNERVVKALKSRPAKASSSRLRLPKAPGTQGRRRPTTR
jgi:ankyrin repeat protein